MKNSCTIATFYTEPNNNNTFYMKYKQSGMYTREIDTRNEIYASQSKAILFSYFNWEAIMYNFIVFYVHDTMSRVSLCMEDAKGKSNDDMFHVL